MSDISTLIKERRSVRAPFDPSHPIAMQDVQQILEAARWSPTAHNMQNFEIVVVDDKEHLKKLGDQVSAFGGVHSRELRTTFDSGGRTAQEKSGNTWRDVSSCVADSGR